VHADVVAVITFSFLSFFSSLLCDAYSAFYFSSYLIVHISCQLLTNSLSEQY
jgi:hypothetical protein